MSIPFLPKDPSILTVVSTAVGMAGGLLGFYTFLDNYLLRFKPKFATGESFYFVFKKHDKADYTYIESIIFQTEIFNHRNKLGKIDGIYIKAYASRHLEPTIVNLHASSFLSEIPANTQNILSCQRNCASTININNKSAKSVVLEMVQSYGNRATLPIDGEIVIELIYKLKAGRLKSAKKFSVHHHPNKKHEVDGKTIYIFELFEKFNDTSNLEKYPLNVKRSSYRGVSAYYIDRLLGALKYKAARSVMYFISVYISLIHAGSAFLRSIFSETVEWNIAKAYGPKRRSVRVTVGDKKKADLTESYLAKLFVILTKKVCEMNKKSQEEEKVALSKSGNEIILKKKSSTIKMYKSGDGHIHAGLVSATGKYTETILSLTVQQYPLGVHLWFNNKRALFPSTVATRLVDFISLHGVR
jgi:hypothetical protein